MSSSSSNENNNNNPDNDRIFLPFHERLDKERLEALDAQLTSFPDSFQPPPYEEDKTGSKELNVWIKDVSGTTTTESHIHFTSKEDEKKYKTMRAHMELTEQDGKERVDPFEWEEMQELCPTVREKRSEIILDCVTANGAPVLARVQGFRPYFYARVPPRLVHTVEQKHLTRAHACDILQTHLQTHLDEVLDAREAKRTARYGSSSSSKHKPRPVHRLKVKWIHNKFASLRFHNKNKERVPMFKIFTGVPGDVSIVRNVLMKEGIRFSAQECKTLQPQAYTLPVVYNVEQPTNCPTLITYPMTFLKSGFSSSSTSSEESELWSLQWSVSYELYRGCRQAFMTHKTATRKFWDGSSAAQTLIRNALRNFKGVSKLLMAPLHWEWKGLEDPDALCTDAKALIITCHWDENLSAALPIKQKIEQSLAWKTLCTSDAWKVLHTPCPVFLQKTQQSVLLECPTEFLARLNDSQFEDDELNGQLATHLEDLCYKAHSNPKIFHLLPVQPRTSKKKGKEKDDKNEGGGEGEGKTAVQSMGQKRKRVEGGKKKNQKGDDKGEDDDGNAKEGDWVGNKVEDSENLDVDDSDWGFLDGNRPKSATHGLTEEQKRFLSNQDEEGEDGDGGGFKKEIKRRFIKSVTLVRASPSTHKKAHLLVQAQPMAKWWVFKHFLALGSQHTVNWIEFLQVFECNVLYPLRFFLDTFLGAGSWITLPAKTWSEWDRPEWAPKTYSTFNIDIPKHNTIISRHPDAPNGTGTDPKWSIPPDLRGLSWDIECAAQVNFPNPRWDPVIQIGHTLKVKKKEHCMGFTLKKVADNPEYTTQCYPMQELTEHRIGRAKRSLWNLWNNKVFKAALRQATQKLPLSERNQLALTLKEEMVRRSAFHPNLLQTPKLQKWERALRYNGRIHSRMETDSDRAKDATYSSDDDPQFWDYDDPNQPWQDPLPIQIGKHRALFEDSQTQGHAMLRRFLSQLEHCSPSFEAWVVHRECERKFLNDSVTLMRRTSPDYITGWNCERFDLQYVLRRGLRIGAHGVFYMARIANPLQFNRTIYNSKSTGKKEVWQIKNAIGLLYFDAMLLWAADKLRNNCLDTVASIDLKQRKMEIDHTRIRPMYDRNEDQRYKLLQYCVQDTRLPIRLLDKRCKISNLIEMARVTHLPISLLLSRGQGIRTAFLLMKVATPLGLLKPYSDCDQRDEDENQFQGATVIEPVRGVHYNPICTLDFKSLYPSIMLAYNVGYLTIVRPRDYHLYDKDELTWHDVGDGQLSAFVKKDLEESLLNRILNQLLGARQGMKDRRKFTGTVTKTIEKIEKVLQDTHPTDSLDAKPEKKVELEKLRGQLNKCLGLLDAMDWENLSGKDLRNSTLLDQIREKADVLYAVYDGAQLAYKVCANSTYGYVSGFDLRQVEIGAVVTYRGRTLINDSKKMVEEWYTKGSKWEDKTGKEHICNADTKVVYGDTDSIMIDFGDISLEMASAMSINAERRLNETYVKPIEMEFEKIFWPYLLYNKKRYAGIKYEAGKLDKPQRSSSGLDDVRRGTLQYTREVFKEVVEIMLPLGVKFDTNALTGHKAQFIEAGLKATALARLRGIELLQGLVDLAKLSFSKALSKEVYPTKQVHAELAKKMRSRDPGNAPIVGDRMTYTFVEGPKKAPKCELSEDLMYVRRHKVPVNYKMLFNDAYRRNLVGLFRYIHKPAYMKLATTKEEIEEKKDTLKRKRTDFFKLRSSSTSSKKATVWLRGYEGKKQLDKDIKKLLDPIVDKKLFGGIEYEIEQKQHALNEHVGLHSVEDIYAIGAQARMRVDLKNKKFKQDYKQRCKTLMVGKHEAKLESEAVKKERSKLLAAESEKALKAHKQHMGLDDNWEAFHKRAKVMQKSLGRVAASIKVLERCLACRTPAELTRGLCDDCLTPRVCQKCSTRDECLAKGACGKQHEIDEAKGEKNYQDEYHRVSTEAKVKFNVLNTKVKACWDECGNCSRQWGVDPQDCLTKSCDIFFERGGKSEMLQKQHHVLKRLEVKDVHMTFIPDLSLF